MGIFPGRSGVVWALFLAVLCSGACKSEPKDISETRAELLAGKVMESYCSEGLKDGKCTDYYSKGQVPPTDARFKWAFKYLSEYTDPKRVMIVMVSNKGETSVMLEDVPAEGGFAPPAATPAPAEGH
jgi:hypothetical protein